MSAWNISSSSQSCVTIHVYEHNSFARYQFPMEASLQLLIDVGVRGQLGKLGCLVPSIKRSGLAFTVQFCFGSEFQLLVSDVPVVSPSLG